MLAEARILPGRTAPSLWKNDFTLRAPCPCPRRHAGSLQADKALTQLASKVCSTWHEFWEQLAALIPPKKQKDQKERTNTLMQLVTV